MKNNFFRKWLVLSALFAFLCFSPHMMSRAQSTANYAFSTSTTGSLVDMSTGTTQLIGAGLDASASSVTPIGFSFPFMGSLFTQFSVNEDGVLQLGGTAVGTNIYTIAGGTVALPRLAAFNADLRTGTDGKVHYKVTGSTPNRQLVVEFSNMQVFYTGTAAAGTSTFQMIFSETTGVITYAYGAMNASSVATAGRAPSIGFYQGAATNAFATVNYSTNTASVVAPYAANPNVAATGDITNLNSATNGSRRIYSFVPNTPVAPTALSFSGVTAMGMTLNWTDNSTTELGYRVYRSTDNVNYTLASQLTANTQTYSVLGLSPSTLYYWKVVSYEEVESSPLSGSQTTNAGVLSGVKTVGAGGDYQNLTTAFADINAQGLAGNVELQMISGYPAAPETYPILSCNAIATGAFSVKVYPTVSGLSITSANATGTLNLNGATNVTFDGRVNQAGVNDLVIANTNAGASYAVQFINDARNNALQYLTIQSVNNSTTSGTIVFAGSTGGTTGNDNNLIDHCDIKDGATTPVNAIYSAGTSTAIDNSGNTVSNSNIFNFFNAGNNSNGIFLSSNSSAWTINANKFYQTATRTSTASGNQYRGINIVTSNGSGYVITNNVIGYASATGTGVMTYNGAFTNRYFAIELTASNTGTASSIQGNTITAISLTTTSGSTTAPGIFAGISVLGGTVSIGNTTPNVIGASTGTGAISITTSTTGNVYGIHANSTGTLNVSNNVIGSISGTGSAAGATCNFTGINLPGSGTAFTVNGNTIGGATANSITSGTSGTTTATATVNGIAIASGVTTLGLDGNTISNLTIQGASGTMYGINSGTTQYTFNNNVIHDLRIPANSGTTASIIYGMYNLAVPTVENITNNQIYNLAIAGATTSTGNLVMGIHSNTTTSAKNFSVNQINGLSFANSSTGTAVVNGISSVTGTTVSIFRNKIYNLSASGAGSTVNGILNSGGATVNVYNNVIGDLKAPTASAADPIRGISVTSTAATSTYRVYYNSVYLDAVSTGTNFGTSGIYHTVNATATTAALDLRNNIIINASTPSGTGITAAFRRSGPALGNFASTSNRNLLYAGTPSATRLIMYDGTTSYQTMATYQAAVVPREINSFTGEATFTGTGYGTAGNFFISTTPSSADYLKPVAGITTQAESGAAAITTPAITTDYAAVIRQGNAGYTGTGTAPDLGAFEFEGVTPTPVITLNSVTPPTTTQCVATARVISVDVNPSAGTTASVTLGYTVNGVAQTAITMTNSSGSTWTGTIPAPTPGNATITWGITAVNSVGVSGIYTGTAYSDEPLTGVVSAVTASSSTLCAGNPTTLTAALTKTGTITVGSGSTNTTSVGENPFYGGYGGVKTQYLIRASELTALGLTAGNITQLSMTLVTAGSSLTGFGISASNTALTVLTTNIENVGTQVYSTPSFVPAVGVNNFVFSTPLNWDGVSNIILSFCWSNNNASNTASQITGATTPFVSGNARYVDNKIASDVCGYTGNTTPGGWNGGATTVSFRPNFILTGNKAPAIQSISWSDGVGTVGTTNPLTVSPTATTTYAATITALGCTVTPAPTATITVNPLPSAPTATNSAQCGVQVPTASVTSTSGLPTPSFNWYAASTGGTALQSSTSTTYSATVATTTTFYVSELNSITGCESGRVPVTVSVSTPDQVSLTASVASVCVGETFTLTAANTNPTPFQSYTYSVESAATGSGAETPLAGNPVSVTPTAAGTFTYTVTGVDGGCAASATASVLINPLPAVTATATPATVCSGDNIALVASAVSANDGPFVVGAGALSGSGDYYSPFYHLFGGVKSQYIIRASELTAAGFTAGNLTSVALNIGTVGSAYSGFTIHVGTTAATDLSAGLDASTLTPVYSNTSLVLTASSLNTFNFSTPFFWNGTSNIIVQLSWSNNNGGGTSSEIQYDNMAYVATAYYRADNQSPATVLAGTPGTGTRSTRPKMTFKMNHNNNYTWSWSPGTGLNTPMATTSITNASGSAVTQAFTVTTTNNTTGCVSTTTTPLVTINSSVPAPVANNSAQCGTGTPTASVTGTGTPGNTFSWYLVSTGGTAITGQTGSSLTGYPVTATTTFYVSENSAAGCMSPRTPVTVTVTPAPAISVAGTATICNGSSTSLTASSANTGYTYTWSNGLGTGATVSASPTVGTTYTVTGTDMSGGANNGCVNTATYAITVNPAPTTAPVVPATSIICAGDLQHLTSGPTVSTAIYGNGTTAPSNTSYPNPLSAYYGGAKHQILFTAAELTAQGMVAGSQISSVTFDLNTINATAACTNFTIRMGNTAVNALTGFVTGTSTVYGPTTFTPSAAGLVTFTLTAPFTWNGTSNIVVETVHNAGNTGNGTGTRTNTTTTLANTVYSAAEDNVAGGIAGFDALTAWDVNAASNLRPNIRFAFTGAGPVWSPAASLYTDAAGTLAYTGTNTSSVYAKPTATTTYTVTYTGSNGCTAQTSATITVNQPTSSTVAPVTTCASYTWAQTGMTYTTSGVYRDTIQNAAGCDSVISLNLTINQPSANTVTEIACQTYTWAQNGMTYNASGSYTDTIPNALGCDSVVTLNLTIGAPNGSLFPITSCGSYVWPQTGLTYTTSGAYNDTLTNMFGCDSIVTLSLTINQPTSSSVAPVTECTSYTWSQTGMTYTTSGIYTDTLTNAAGCDSIISLDLTIIQPTTSSVTVSECVSYTWPQNGMTYTTSGAYTDTISNSVGCDSIITLNLTIKNVTTSVVTVSTCAPSYTWAQNGTVYNASGSYIDTIANAAGCDSIVTLNLTIAPFVATATVNANATVTASAGTTYQWINCATNAPVAGATAQTFAPTANGSYAVIVSNGTCTDTSNCVNVTNVGIKESTITTISVHPNPTHDVVTVTMDAASAVVEVMDVQGKLVQTTQIKSGGQIDLSAYERGVYTLRVKTELGVAIERIVKN